MSDVPPPRPPIHLLTAPPIGVQAWSEVARRLAHHGHAPAPVDLFDAHHAGLIREEGTAGLIAHLAERCAGTVVVAHGHAVPIALHLAARVSLHGLVLANGPVQALDPVTRTLSAVAAAVPVVARTLARPSLARPILASSAALRRLVVNPYVMDRDMVVRVTESWTADRDRRVATARWLAELPALVGTAPMPEGPTLLVWGDEDVLYPAHVADLTTGAGVEVSHVRVPGGRHLHPIERPWELADAIHDHLGRAADHDTDVAI